MCEYIVTVFVLLLLISQNGVSGRLKCSNGTFHDLSSPGITGCKPCSKCQEGSILISECRKNRDTVCCMRNCRTDAYLDEKTCECRRCTRTCQPNYRIHVHCGERNDAQCGPVVGASVLSSLHRTPTGKTAQTPSTARHRETSPVVNPDSDATPTADFHLTTVGKSQTPQPHQTSSKHATQSVSNSHATSPPPRDAAVKSTTGVTSTDLTRPLWVITVILGAIVVVTVASLLLYCKITMTCHFKRKSTRSVGVAHDHQWRMQPPLNSLNADRPSLDVGSPDRSIQSNVPSPEAQSSRGVPDSTSIGSFGTYSSMTFDGEEITVRTDEFEREPITAVWKSSAAPAASEASDRCGGSASFYPRPSFSMNNVFPAMSPSPSKVWVDEHGRSNVSRGHYVNGGVHCCHHLRHPDCEQQQVCYHTPCRHDDYCMSSTFSFESLVSGCTV